MNTNDLKKRLSLIDEESRLELGISRDEYALCSYVYFRAQDTRQKFSGWCCDSKVEVANFCGIARSSLYNVAGKMRAMELLEISDEWFLRPTKKWALVEQKCKETLQNILGFTVQKLDGSTSKSVQNLDTKAEKSVQNLDSECPKFGRESAKSVQNLDAHLIREYKEKKEIGKAQSNDCLVGENLDASIHSRLLDPALPNVELHEAIKTEIQRPKPGPAEEKTSLGAAARPTASEVAGYSFESFWVDYDFRKGSKVVAKAKWDKLKAAEIEAIRDTVEMYKRDTVTEDGARGEKFKPLRKYPQFYLNQKTWEAYAEQLEAERNRPKDEWDEKYQAYVKWVAEKYPNVFKSVAYLSKADFICHNTQWYVKGMSDIGKEGIKTLLIRAHDRMEAGVPAAASAGNVFNYQVALLEERVKIRQA